jgi:hypothetical protein
MQESAVKILAAGGVPWLLQHRSLDYAAARVRNACLTFNTGHGIQLSFYTRIKRGATRTRQFITLTIQIAFILEIF